MWKLIKIFLAGIAMSFYFFPFEFSFLPGINTKMAMAGVGLILLCFNLAINRDARVDKGFFIISLWALAVSLMSFCSATINGTSDYAFASYVVSMWVWLGGAYCAVSIIRYVHNYVDCKIVCHYLIGICLLQCVLACFISASHGFSAFVDTFLAGEAYMGANIDTDERMHGIGAALDPAGIRFAAVLVMIAFLSAQSNISKYSTMIYYILSFVVIFVVGNMIARTTTLGGVLSIIYWIISFVFINNRNKHTSEIFIRTFTWILLLIVPLVALLYNKSLLFYDNFRFGFEGFVSLIETGEWNMSSSDILLDHMIVFPDNMSTWIIGDGYAGDFALDPYYQGEMYHGFYMGTDIGYLRFIFYFGLLGTLVFILFFINVGFVSIGLHKSYKQMFILLLLVHFIVWFKVTTDLFVVFALFLCVPTEDNDTCEKLYEDSIPDQLDV